MTSVPSEIMPSGVSWTIGTWAYHSEAMRMAAKDFDEERDRRYSEVNIEREKALKIKETADLAALGLAREIQDYKDEKANNLREQISGERGTYATKDDLASALREIKAEMAPVKDYVISDRGRSAGIGLSWTVISSIAALALSAGYFLHTVFK